MFKDMGFMICFDVITLLLLIAQFYNRQQEVRSCNEDLYKVGWAYVLYLMLFVVRNLLILAVCACTKKPDVNAFSARGVCSSIDSIALTTLVVWATTVLRSDEAIVCYTQPEVEDPNQEII